MSVVIESKEFSFSFFRGRSPHREKDNRTEGATSSLYSSDSALPHFFFFFCRLLLRPEEHTAIEPLPVRLELDLGT